MNGYTDDDIIRCLTAVADELGIAPSDCLEIVEQMEGWEGVRQIVEGLIPPGLGDMSNEILARIASNLSRKQLTALCLSSRRFYSLCQDDYILKNTQNVFTIAVDKNGSIYVPYEVKSKTGATVNVYKVPTTKDEDAKVSRPTDTLEGMQFSPSVYNSWSVNPRTAHLRERRSRKQEAVRVEEDLPVLYRTHFPDEYAVLMEYVDGDTIDYSDIEDKVSRIYKYTKNKYDVSEPGFIKFRDISETTQSYRYSMPQSSVNLNDPEVKSAYRHSRQRPRKVFTLHSLP